jgi:hypothetical protein
MRFFAPVFLRPCEFHWLKVGMRRTSPVAVSVAFHGLVPFTPVRVSNVLLRTFDSQWIGNPYPGLDLDTLRGCLFPYAFLEDGTYDKDASAEEKVLFTTEYDGRLVGGIRVPRILRDGDILLANRKYGERAGDLLRSLELK